MAIDWNNIEEIRKYRRDYMREYNKSDKSKEYRKNYRINNRDRINQLKSESQKRNRKASNIRSARLRAKPKRKEYEKNWRIKNRIKLNKYHVEMKLNKPEYYLACRLRSNLNKALTRYVNNKNYPTIFAKYDIDINKIIQHLLPIPKDRNEYHIDHIKPVCSFDFTDENQIKKCFSPENLRWLPAKENMSKGGSSDKLQSIYNEN